MERWTTFGADKLTLPGAQSLDEQMQRYMLYDQAIEDWLIAFLNLWIGV